MLDDALAYILPVVGVGSGGVGCVLFVLNEVVVEYDGTHCTGGCAFVAADNELVAQLLSSLCANKVGTSHALTQGTEHDGGFCAFIAADVVVDNDFVTCATSEGHACNCCES